MPATDNLRSLTHFGVTPRFEIFYALRALDQEGKFADRWRNQVKRGLPPDFRAVAKRVGPQPMMWPLLADSLRDSKGDPTFQEMLENISSLDDGMFQRGVLSGVFRSAEIVDDLIAGRQSLRDAVKVETRKKNALLGVIGLDPFQRASAVVGAFTMIVSSPAEYRNNLSNVLETFWTGAFSENWKSLEARMKRRAEFMEEAVATTSLSAFAATAKLPVVFDDGNGTISSERGVTMFRYRNVKEIHVIPSAFNDSRFWGAYTDSDGSVRLYFPVFDPELMGTATIRAQNPASRSVVEAVDPAIVFRALGDTTRYAMACVLARSPRTSVELATDFSVSKATISHHVQVLRQARLIRERVTDKGVALSLDREALELFAGEAARAIFASDEPVVIKRSRHEGGKRK